MKSSMLLASGMAPMIVCGLAVADVDFDFELLNSNGEESVSYVINVEGALDSIDFSIDFTNTGDFTWAGDVLFGFTDPNGNSIEFGGYNVSFGYTVAGDFPADWDSSTSGTYGYSADLASYGLSGAGDWTVEVANGYTTSVDTSWSGVLGMNGLAVPAPGALALLGLAGLAGRRRRG
ncbi:MAG: hypothetical protein P8J59_02750 [Phycisphaerales bacterium]|jgi:hypothetical protein|nr:hypothetical protein [Phycisphaerales bacterium]